MLNVVRFFKGLYSMFFINFKIYFNFKYVRMCVFGGGMCIIEIDGILVLINIFFYLERKVTE